MTVSTHTPINKRKTFAVVLETPHNPKFCIFCVCSVDYSIYFNLLLPFLTFAIISPVCFVDYGTSLKKT